MRCGSAIPRPKWTSEALTDIHNDKNNEPCPVFPRNSPICLCTKQQLSENTALLMIAHVCGTEDSAASDKEWQFTGPIHCSTAFPRLWTCSFNTMTHNQDSPFHSAHHCGSFSPFIFRARSIIIPIFPVLMLDLMLKKNNWKKRPRVLFHPAYKKTDLK